MNKSLELDKLIKQHEELVQLIENIYPYASNEYIRNKEIIANDMLIKINSLKRDIQWKELEN